MSRTAQYMPAEARDRRRAQIRESVARHKERMDALSNLERVAWKIRHSVGDGFDPYTPEERERLEHIRSLQTDLEGETERLNALLRKRYENAVKTNPDLAPFLGELEAGRNPRITLKPH